jgi:hypothetical protein
MILIPPSLESCFREESHFFLVSHRKTLDLGG